MSFQHLPNPLSPSLVTTVLTSRYYRRQVEPNTLRTGKVIPFECTLIRLKAFLFFQGKQHLVWLLFTFPSHSFNVFALIFFLFIFFLTAVRDIQQRQMPLKTQKRMRIDVYFWILFSARGDGRTEAADKRRRAESLLIKSAVTMKQHVGTAVMTGRQTRFPHIHSFSRQP